MHGLSRSWRGCCTVALVDRHAPVGGSAVAQGKGTPPRAWCDRAPHGRVGEQRIATHIRRFPNKSTYTPSRLRTYRLKCINTRTHRLLKTCTTNCGTVSRPQVHPYLLARPPDHVIPFHDPT